MSELEPTTESLLLITQAFVASRRNMTEVKAKGKRGEEKIGEMVGNMRKESSRTVGGYHTEQAPPGCMYMERSWEMIRTEATDPQPTDTKKKGMAKQSRDCRLQNEYHPLVRRELA